MFDEPEESPEEAAAKPAERAKEKADEFRMHAELAAVYEGPRKFDARIIPGLDANIARDVQRTIGRLEKAKTPDSPVLPESAAADAAKLLDLFAGTPAPDGDEVENDLPTSDYHIYRRPGEVMMVRWLAGDEVETFYERLQAHFDVAMEGFREDERHSQEWKQDPETLAYLKALEDIKISMPERYLRDYIRKHNLYVLSTQTADEINIAYLCDHIMNVPAVQVVGEASAPPDDGPTEKDLAWYFKLFSLRGMKDGQERMCFFTYLQKTDDDGW